MARGGKPTTTHVAKVVTWGEDRAAALARLRQALENGDLRIVTNVNFYGASSTIRPSSLGTSIRG